MKATAGAPVAGSGARSGFLAVAGACLLWGVFPFYFKLLGGAHPLEAMAHRVLWAVPALAVVLWARREWRPLHRALTRRGTLLGLVATSLLITLNWTVYVVAVFAGNVLDASLGYFMSPLLSVLFGVVVLKERLRPLQTAAVVLAGLAVLNMVVSLGLVPVVALTLAFSFAGYGLVRKRLPVGPAVGLMAECLITLPIVTGFLVYVGARQGLAFGTDLPLSLLLVLAGPITVLPLILFNLGAKRLPLATVGLILYTIPSLLFLEGVFVFKEPAEPLKIATFAAIWVALGLYSWDGFRRK
ncbi:MAG: EamA family transporter RarD [Geminicoccaceae bacterium]|nr:EamA family transporter RarD [Geminicoccaceae bacterium]